MGGPNLARIGERDHSIALKSPNAYFQADDTKLSDPVKRRFFVDIEGDLQGLRNAEACSACGILFATQGIVEMWPQERAP